MSKHDLRQDIKRWMGLQNAEYWSWMFFFRRLRRLQMKLTPWLHGQPDVR